MPNFVLNGNEFYNAPKNGGTTVRMWLKFYEEGLPQNFDPHGYYNLAGVGLPRLWTDNAMGKPQFFSPGAPNNCKWCIVRNPVDRFISAYTEKILLEKLAPWTISTCLSLLESGEMERIARSSKVKSLKQAACHLLGQCFWFGCDRSYFDHVFHIQEMSRVRDFCEKVVFKMPLPDFHARDQSQTKIDKVKLTNSEVKRLEEIFADDYSANWF
ncbi:MAG: sulfotransferase family 2 domain-containing protein [Pararhodobacter sp.]|nr:sulfotransferase family 2 domain-containing protein [Pararhodobacter sp.]